MKMKKAARKLINLLTTAESAISKSVVSDLSKSHLSVVDEINKSPVDFVKSKSAQEISSYVDSILDSIEVLVKFEENSLIAKGYLGLISLYEAMNLPNERLRILLIMGNYFISANDMEIAKKAHEIILKDFDIDTDMSKEIGLFLSTYYTQIGRPELVVKNALRLESLKLLYVLDKTSLKFALSIYMMMANAYVKLGFPLLALDCADNVIEILNHDNAEFMNIAKLLSQLLDLAYNQLVNPDLKRIERSTYCSRCLTAISKDQEIYCFHCRTLFYCSEACRDSSFISHENECFDVHDFKKQWHDGKYNAAFAKVYALIEQMKNVIGTNSTDLSKLSLKVAFPLYKTEHLMILQRNLVSLLYENHRCRPEFITFLGGLEEHYSKTNQCSAGNWQTFLLKAKLCLKYEKNELALESIRKAIEIFKTPKPHGTKVYLGTPTDFEEILVKSLLANNLYQEAVDQYQKVSTTKLSINIALEYSMLFLDLHNLLVVQLLDKILLEMSNMTTDVQKQSSSKIKMMVNETLIDRSERKWYWHGKLKVCAGCWKVASRRGQYFRCSGCEAVYYCNQECQHSHWETHRSRCNEICANKKSTVVGE